MDDFLSESPFSVLRLRTDCAGACFYDGAVGSILGGASSAKISCQRMVHPDRSMAHPAKKQSLRGILPFSRREHRRRTIGAGNGECEIQLFLPGYSPV